MKTIYRLPAIFCLALAVCQLALPHAAVSAQPLKQKLDAARAPLSVAYPCIIDGPSNADSQLVLKAARLAFQSACSDAFNAGPAVRKKMKELVVWPLDASDITADTTQLTIKKAAGSESDGAGADSAASKFICVQKTPYQGTRFAVRQKYFNWQGDWFNILLVKSKDTADQIFSKIDNIEIGPDTLPEGYVSITRDTWQKPWILRNDATGKMLAVDTQHPGEVLADWDVYAPAREGKAEIICKIRFRKPSKTAAALLPSGPLSQLAMLLDKIIGIPKEDEGTFHATDRLRNEVEHMWGNLLFRPWAMAEPDTARATVDRHLKKWQKGARAFHGQYVQLQALYPQAQAALARYYQQAFGKPPDKAQKMAAKNLDLAYRSHFKL